VILMIGPLLLTLQAQQSDQDKLPGADDCLMCHQPGRAAKREPGVPPPLDAVALRASPHAALDYISCHDDLAGKEFPHAEKLQRVNCGNCHAAEQEQQAASLHGQAAKRGDKLAPK
jgi:mono/diheme cytochrome c family protein